MMHNKLMKGCLVMSILLLTSCKYTTQNDTQALQAINDSIKKVFAPDKRVAVYDINLASQSEQVTITGETDQEEGIATLIRLLKNKGKTVKNLSDILPDSSTGEWKYALVNNSVANIRSVAKHSGELATQAILGTPLKLLKIDGDFYLVQSPDGYISWVDHGGVALMTSKQYLQWETSQKVIFTNTFGFVYSEMNNDLDKIADIVMGSQLMLINEFENYFKVQFPDNREGYLKKSESQPYQTWLQDVKSSGTLIELYAKELLGVPYLWGGTSSKGMDCSGFTKTVFLMNGYVIPRDASQQIMAGTDVDPQLAFKNLQKGDLMFFGKKATDSTKQRVTHVGIWLDNGQGEFIHASGRVKIASINPDNEHYDAFNKNRYLGSKRYLDVNDPMIIDLKKISKEKLKS